MFLVTGITKKILGITRNKNKKHDRILMMAKSKLNSIENVVSQALFDMEISHEKTKKQKTLRESELMNTKWLKKKVLKSLII